MELCISADTDLLDSDILNEDELAKAIENLKSKVDEITNDLKEVKQMT